MTQRVTLYPYRELTITSKVQECCGQEFAAKLGEFDYSYPFCNPHFSRSTQFFLLGSLARAQIDHFVFSSHRYIHYSFIAIWVAFAGGGEFIKSLSPPTSNRMTSVKEVDFLCPKDYGFSSYILHCCD